MNVWPHLPDVLCWIIAIAPGDTAALKALLPGRWESSAHPEQQFEQGQEGPREAQTRRSWQRAALPFCRQ